MDKITDQNQPVGRPLPALLGIVAPASAGPEQPLDSSAVPASPAAGVPPARLSGA
jgi:hypothetical protein